MASLTERIMMPFLHPFLKRKVASALRKRAAGARKSEPDAMSCGSDQLRSTCNPHSWLPSYSHHQRPARSDSPAAIGRVHGAHPIDAKPRLCSGLSGMLWADAKAT